MTFRGTFIRDTLLFVLGPVCRRAYRKIGKGLERLGKLLVVRVMEIIPLAHT